MSEPGKTIETKVEYVKEDGELRLLVAYWPCVIVTYDVKTYSLEPW